MRGSSPAPRRATIADVAEAVGVSRATVSKALNGRGDISAETRDRVLQADAARTHRAPTGPAHASARSCAGYGVGYAGSGRVPR